MGLIISVLHDYKLYKEIVSYHYYYYYYYPVTASIYLQDYLNILQPLSNTWKIKIIETKSANVTFTLRKKECTTVSIHNTRIPMAQACKYSSIHQDGLLKRAPNVNG